jgi:hypothetical protein
LKDFIALENLKIPGAIVCSTCFCPPTLALAKVQGASGMPIIDIRHPMHTATKDEVFKQAEAAFDKILQALTITPSNPQPAANDDPLGDTLTIGEDRVSVNDYFQEKGWTDGLPIVPPTVERVERMVSLSGHDLDREIGAFPPLMRKGTVRQIAANAVMAGCLPEYFPAVLSSLEAMLDDDCQLSGIQAATNAATPLLFFNGPIVKTLKLNSGGNIFGTGCRANATIGRAAHLVLQNIGGEVPGETDLSTHGQPGKFTFCIAEAEDTNPWEPYHVEKGFDRHASTVSVVGSNGPQNIFAYGCETGEQILDTIVGAVTAMGNNNIIFSTGPLIILSPEHAAAIANSGYSKRKVKEYLFEKGRIPLTAFAPKTREGLLHRRSRWFERNIDSRCIGMADDADDITIIVAGGAGIHSQFLSTCFSRKVVTRQITI